MADVQSAALQKGAGQTHIERILVGTDGSSHLSCQWQPLVADQVGAFRYAFLVQANRLVLQGELTFNFSLCPLLGTPLLPTCSGL